MLLKEVIYGNIINRIKGQIFMSDLSEHFKIDVTTSRPRENCVFKGNYYRISVLSDVLLRLEYKI